MPLDTDNDQESVVSPDSKETKESNTEKPKVDPDHPLLNVGGKVEDNHSDYMVDMLTN